ncbi:DNA repair protein RecN [Marixanthomonas sp. SCSIO 43207]|uniref:DNA repair protein RecN n=1 Tax=Marixanthomonas sp. SCSIO 43207 TaxID=2779360 RepID=UPI001CA7C37A|nr:DNA repair protein RecN [Marixanthomonas sp. SCSIO 43207]UAB81164.1 DNA repair protein RecN [Marixanthomonas sp. SCSIO 43207]
MITTIAIKNYALIEDIRMDFNNGLTIITGETGAGKSILLGALSLVLGKRADLNSMRDASKKCVIEAEFSIEKFALQTIFETNDLDYDAHTIIRREILPSGKSRAFINDTPVTLSQLQAVGPYLVDIHSQHETLSLSEEDFQLQVIDALANNQDHLKTYSNQVVDLKNTEKALKEAQLKKSEAAKEIDYNTFLFNELEEANLTSINQKELEETYETLSNAEEIKESLAAVVQLFSEEQIGTLETAKEARASLNKLKNYGSVYQSLWDRLNSVIIELDDLNEEIEQVATSVEADPNQLLEINEKLQTLHKLQQKHNVATVSELIAIKDSLDNQITDTNNLDTLIEKLEKQVSTLTSEARKTGKSIHESRKKVLPTLKERLENILSKLGLPNARFEFKLAISETFREHGIDTLELLFTANKGMSMGSIKKVASGGEMSRIMLAVKAVLAEYKTLPTLIFDEIDTGVSGEIAHKMAIIMDEMSKTMQLVSITHLPQIASKGAQHIKVYKEDVNNSTVTGLKTLTQEERIVEIAQMIGGKEISDSALAHAKELLN